MEQEIKRNIPRDLFLHLLAIVTLYWSAVSFVTLLWQYINYFIPDVLYYYPGSFNGPMRFATASLIIVFPVFILDSWYLNKIYKKEYAVRESKIRKWLLYFTLFAAAVIVIGDLVSIINTFLGGDITTKFILKASSILVVAVAVFWYYLDDVRKDNPTKMAKPFALVISLIILVGVVGAFFIVGSPATARLVQYDEQRISALENIQYQVVNYWQRKGALPEKLADLEDSISGFRVPVDPQNNEYEYVVKDVATLSFELCATFNKPSTNQLNQKSVPAVTPSMGYTDNWAHSSGRVCFERAIDKQLYPPLTK